MKKRLISFVVSLSMIMGLFGVFPMSVSAATSGYYTYTVSEGNAKITDVDAAISGDITIPSELGGYPVTSIGGHAFDYCYSLVSINIPDSVTSIDTGAFYGCESLVSIDIPDSVTSIGYCVFSNCTSLVSINIPDSVTSIGASAFYGCESLVSIDIPDSVTSIGSDMFYRCTSLVSIDIPDGVTSIGYGAFTKCYSLVNIDIPDSVTSIGDDAFYSCESLVSINIPDSVTSIGNRAFIWCKSLVSIDIPDSVISIGDHVFSYCYSLVSIDIPESVTSIGDHVFCYCYRLVSINIPESVTSIGSSAFFGCDSLTDVYYGGSESDWVAISVGLSNSCLLNAMIHYNSGSGSETAELNSGITINSSGVAFARFALKNKSGKPYANKTVTYTIDGYNFTDTTATDGDGIATIKTPYLSGAGETKTLTVRFDDANLKSNTYRFDVYIKDLSFLQTWQGKINVGAGVEAAFGVSGKLGVAEGEAKLASIGADIKSSRGLSLTNSYNDGVRSLLLASNISSDIGVEGKLGIFAKASFTGIKGAEISAGDVSGGARTGGSHEVALNIENYNPDNEDHVAQIGFFLLDCMSQISGSNVLIRSILNTFDIATYNEKMVGTAAHLQAGAKLGAIEAGNFSADLVGVGTDTVWTYKAKEDKDGKNKYSSKITTDAGISFGNVEFKVKGDKGASGYTPSGSASESIFSHEFLNNELEFSATENGGELEEFEITMLAENNNNSILWYEENEDYNQVFSYKGDDADIVVAANDKLKEFTNGEKGWFSTWAMADAAQDALNSDVDADYTKEKEISQGIDAYLNFGLTALLGFEFGLGFSGIESNSYDIEDGISEDNVLYIQSQSDIDSAVEAEEMTLLEIFQEPINTVSNAIKDTFDSVAGKIGDGIEQGMAKIKGEFNGLVSIFTPKSTNAALSYKVLAIDSDTASLATSSVASTLGSPYVIKAEDDGGNIITEFADGEVVLELSYDSGMLASAGVSDNETALDGLKIYRWDDTKSVYINLGGTLDYENSKVELAITKPGQYILAYDNCAPSVTQFASSDYSATPVITAEVADMSGICEFEFKIDGNTVVDAETFDDYYTYSTAVFKYSVDSPLADGEHTATIYATDTSGNKMLMPAELEFTVDTIAPVISDVVIPQKAIGTLELSAVVDDDDVEVVNAYIKTDSKTYCYTMENNSGIWEIEISRLPECESADVYLAAFDIYENESRTEVASVEIQNFIKGDAMKDGKINNLDSIRIAQHIAWGIKLSDYELKAADVNDDKRVNNLDLIKLAQKLAGWTIEW